MAQPARQFHTQQVHYLRKRITYADNGTVVQVGTIPAGSIFLKTISGVVVRTAFNGDTTNTVSIGPSTDSGTDLWATALALGSIGPVGFDEAVAQYVSSDTIASATVTSTASASAGVAEVIICYIPNNDG